MSSASYIPLAYSQEIHNQRYAAHHNGYRSASPYIVVEGSRNKLATPSSLRTQTPSSFQQQPAPNLFSDLLFNREQVYGGSSVPSSQAAKGLPLAQTEDISAVHGSHLRRPLSSTSNKQKEDEYSSASDMTGVLSHLRGMAPVSNKTGGTRKKAATKGATKAKALDSKPKKRPASRTIGSQVKKQQKTELDSKKKFNSLVGSVPKRLCIQDSIVIDSDTEPDFDLPLAQVNLENKLTRMEAEHTTELQRLRKELEDAKAETESVRRHMQKKLDDAELQRAKSGSQADKEYANLERKLIREQAEFSLVRIERDQLRSEVEAAKTRCDNVLHELQEQRQLNEQANKDHTRDLEDLTRTKDSELAAATSSHQEQLSSLQADNARLKQEVEAQTATAVTALASQASTTSASVSASSPAPSSACLTDEEIKTDNVRKTYVKVKRRFDSLHAVAVNLARCTRGLDLTSFGEFGYYVKQLKTALDEDGLERQGMVVVRSASREAEVKCVV